MRRHPSEDKDTGTDDGADAEGGQLHRSQHAVEPSFAGLFTQQLTERFGREELSVHGPDYNL